MGVFVSTGDELQGFGTLGIEEDDDDFGDEGDGLSGAYSGVAAAARSYAKIVRERRERTSKLPAAERGKQYIASVLDSSKSPSVSMVTTSTNIFSMSADIAAFGKTLGTREKKAVIAKLEEKVQSLAKSKKTRGRARAEAMIITRYIACLFGIPL